ncbi:MAG: hypothetical protein K6F07_02965 [Bacilli bacterium]|nr:hypothetical protein [Bacilli bacterium]
MKNFTLAHSILLQILEDQISFSLAMRNAFKDEKNKTLIRHDISALVGCSLRHYLVFKNRIDERFAGLNTQQTAYLLLALSNHLFIHLTDDNKVNKELARLSGIEGFEEFVSSIEPSKLIPEKYPFESDEYLSLRYNTPQWLVKMWRKHYGNNLTYRILKANAKSANKYFIGKEDYDFDDKFEQSSVPGVYKCLDEKVLKTRENLLPATPAMQYALNEMDIDPLRGLAIYSEVTSNLLYHLSPLLNKYSKFDILCGSSPAFFESKRLAKALDLSKADIYEVQSGGFITVLSAPVHSLIVMPNNSLFSALRNKPEFFLRINQEELDGYISHEYEALSDAKKYVEEGGDMLYMIETMSNKEGHGNIERFLKENQDEFTLVDEKQFFPCNSLESAFYFAILRRRGNQND